MVSVDIAEIISNLENEKEKKLKAGKPSMKFIFDLAHEKFLTNQYESKDFF